MTAKKFLTKDEILGASDFEVREVEVPEWEGGYVRLKTMTGVERDKFEATIMRRKKIKGHLDLQGVKVLLLSLVIVDEKGELMFTKDDLATLNRKAAKPISDLFGVAQQMNGLADEDVKEMVGNSEDAPSEEDGSDLQESSDGL